MAMREISRGIGQGPWPQIMLLRSSAECGLYMQWILFDAGRFA
jgi:hypothetical protein